MLLSCLKHQVRRRSATEKQCASRAAGYQMQREGQMARWQWWGRLCPDLWWNSQSHSQLNQSWERKAKMVSGQADLTWAPLFHRHRTPQSTAESCRTSKRLQGLSHWSGCCEPRLGMHSRPRATQPNFLERSGWPRCFPRRQIGWLLRQSILLGAKSLECQGPSV